MWLRSSPESLSRSGLLVLVETALGVVEALDLVVDLGAGCLVALDLSALFCAVVSHGLDQLPGDTVLTCLPLPGFDFFVLAIFESV